MNFHAASRYKLTFRMRAHVLMHKSKWVPYEMTQWQCMQLGFLSGDYDGYFVYNNVVQRCGNVIKFTNNTREDSSVNTRYSFLT